MKKGEIFIKSMILGIVLTSLSCTTDEPLPESVQDLTFAELSGEWSFGSNGFIRVDGSDVSPNYPDFSLSFAEETYSTTNAASLFNASGTWEWSGSDPDMADQIDLDDGKTITITEISPSILIFTFTKSDGSVRAGIAGNYQIRVEK